MPEHRTLVIVPLHPTIAFLLPAGTHQIQSNGRMRYDIYSVPHDCRKCYQRPQMLADETNKNPRRLMSFSLHLSSISPLYERRVSYLSIKNVETKRNLPVNFEKKKVGSQLDFTGSATACGTAPYLMLSRRSCRDTSFLGRPLFVDSCPTTLPPPSAFRPSELRLSWSLFPPRGAGVWRVTFMPGLL